MLEAEVRRDVGQPVRPQDSSDDEVKLMALQALQNTVPEEAIPMLEKVLEGTASPQAEAAGAVRAGAEQLAEGARRAAQLRQGIVDAGPAEPGDSVSRRAGRPRSRAPSSPRSTPPPPTSTSSAASCARSWSRARRTGCSRRRRASRIPSSAPKRSAARQHGRARRAVAALSEGNVGRREAADHPLDVQSAAASTG